MQRLYLTLETAKMQAKTQDKFNIFLHFKEVEKATKKAWFLLI